MKIKHTSETGTARRSLLIAICLVALLGLAAWRMLAADVIINARTVTADGITGTVVGDPGILAVTNTTVSGTNGTLIPLPNNGADIALWVPLVGAGSGTAPVTLGFNLSPSSNLPAFSTTTPITVTATANGTTPVMYYVVIKATNFTGAAYMRWDTLTSTQATKITVSPPTFRYLYAH